MESFYSKCGALRESFVRTTGSLGSRTHTAVFVYANGQAEYDGREWKFAIINK